MTISRKCVAVVVSLLVAASQAVVVDVQITEAQILNASVPTSSEGVQTAAGNPNTVEEQGGFLPVSWPSVSLPQVSMPKMTMPKIPMPTWPTNADGSAVSPFAPITAGASKISAGTRKAWEGAKEMFGFSSSFDSDGRATQLAAYPSEPSFWQRMTGREPEPTGPRTIAEFMAQPRVGQ